MRKFLIWINHPDNQYDFAMYLILIMLIIIISPVFYYSL